MCSACGGVVACPRRGAGDCRAKAGAERKLPPPQVLEHGVALERDPVTGELRARQATSPGAEQASPTIRAQVTLVEAGSTVIAPDGTRVRGLAREDFGSGRTTSSRTLPSLTLRPRRRASPWWSTPARVFFASSPVCERRRGHSRSFLRPQDQVAVVAFAGETNLLLPFSPDRGLLDAALGSAQLERVANSSQSFIYQAVFLTARRLFAGRPRPQGHRAAYRRPGQRVGSDVGPASMQRVPAPRSSLAFDDVARELARRGLNSTSFPPRTGRAP